jgi:anti-sigma-K factor RskA
MTEHDNIEELLAAYALGAVSEQERHTIERAVATDPQLARMLDEHLDTVAMLSGGLLTGDEQPPAGLWDRIHAEIDETADLAPVVPLRRFSYNRVLAAVSAAAVAAVALLSVQVVRQRAEIGDLRDRPLTVAVDEAREAGATTVALTGEVEAEVVLAADGTGFLVGEDLPALTADQTYQLWAVVEGRVISAGVLGPDPDLAVFHVDGDVDLFALTVEVAGGVVVSESGAVSAGEVGA